jgi:hypothetical protein
MKPTGRAQVADDRIDIRLLHMDGHSCCGGKLGIVEAHVIIGIVEHGSVEVRITSPRGTLFLLRVAYHV